MKNGAIPTRRLHFDYMLTYSPYDNVKGQGLSRDPWSRLHVSTIRK